mgnify:CR=1 FL=1
MLELNHFEREAQACGERCQALDSFSNGQRAGQRKLGDFVLAQEYDAGMLLCVGNEVLEHLGSRGSSRHAIVALYAHARPMSHAPTSSLVSSASSIEGNGVSRPSVLAAI